MTHHIESTLRVQLEQAWKLIDRLRAEVEALRKDAKRYRWLRKYGDSDCCEKDGFGGSQLMSNDRLDAAIDTLRQEEEK